MEIRFWLFDVLKINSVHLSQLSVLISIGNFANIFLLRPRKSFFDDRMHWSSPEEGVFVARCTTPGCTSSVTIKINIRPPCTATSLFATRMYWICSGDGVYVGRCNTEGCKSSVTVKINIGANTSKSERSAMSGLRWNESRTTVSSWSDSCKYCKPPPQ